MEGVALITALRNADNKEPKTPIIALAAYKGKDEENNVKQAGANEFIAKPPRSEQCEKLLSKYIPRFLVKDSLNDPCCWNQL